MATTGPFNGRSLGVFVNNTLIACAKSCSLSIKMSAMDVTCNDSDNWAHTLPTTKDWTVTSDGLVVLSSSNNAVNLMDLLTAGTKIIVKFATQSSGTRTSGDVYWYGSAYVISCNMNAGMDEPVSYTASFQGTGVLTKATMT